MSDFVFTGLTSRHCNLSESNQSPNKIVSLALQSIGCLMRL
jgi:hypothetical protein